ncbi:MAG TPA: hypothetical protein VHM70_33030 [Polyangiaceae bacterium]|jgi:hypothetical protein|nr:hypothetical protein [Polyangiaceae bacterium]
MKRLLTLLLALAAFVLNSPQAKAQANCNTPAGVLALMLAKVVVGTPQDPSTLPAASNLPFRISSELFQVAQNNSSATSCASKLTFEIYASTSSTALNDLPTLAAANADFVPASSISRTAMAKTRSGNDLTASTALSRTTYPTTVLHLKGQRRVRNQVFYRIGKRIRNCDSCIGQDPYVFSKVFSFLVPDAPPPPPPPEPKADLVPFPSSHSNVNRPLFQPSGGSFSANLDTFLALPSNFCQGLGDGTQVTTYPCSTGTCNERKHALALGPVTFAAKNTGNAASGAFSITLSRKESVSGVTGLSIQVASADVTALAAGAQSANFSFNPNKTVDVYTFPEDNPTSCFVKCDRNQAGCILDYEEEGYSIKVDGGNNAVNGGAVQERSETNNEGDPMN